VGDNARNGVIGKELFNEFPILVQSKLNAVSHHQLVDFKSGCGGHIHTHFSKKKGTAGLKPTAPLLFIRNTIARKTEIVKRSLKQNAGFHPI
jgi:hypothetical protein